VGIEASACARKLRLRLRHVIASCLNSELASVELVKAYASS